MDKKVTDKIKEILSESDLKIFEDAIEKMVTEKVSMREEELKARYEEISEKYVTEEVSKRLESEKAKLIESYDSKLANLETKVVSKLDSFFDNVIAEQISDATIEKIAINEVFSPVVEGIKKVYAENFIELNSDGSKKLMESDKTIKKLETQLSESMAKLMESEERLQKTATYLLISEKTEGMLVSEKQRITKMFKDKGFSEVKDKIDTFVGMIKESASVGTSKVVPKASVKTVEKKKILGESVEFKDNIDAKKANKPIVAKSDIEDELSKIANRYM